MCLYIQWSVKEWLSKENSSAANLLEEVVSHSDPTNAKYFLWEFFTKFPVLGTEKQCQVSEPLVDKSWDVSQLRKGETDVIKENIEYLSEVLENAKTSGSKKFDVAGFLTQNVNLK